MTGRVVAEKRGAIGWIIFDQSERHNAISMQMWQQIPAAAQQLEADSEVRAVIMRGAGEAAFVAGADISEFERSRNRENVSDYDQDSVRAFAALAAITKPLIAMIHGYCVGGGVALALCADLRYAAEDASFGIPAARLGLGYGIEGIEALSQIVGYANAKEIFFTAKRFPAQRALQMGLVNALFAKDRLESEVVALAEQIAKNAPLTVRSIKLAVRELQKPADARDMEEAKRAIKRCYDSEDYREGVAAFMNKRPPQFKGA